MAEDNADIERLKREREFLSDLLDLGELDEVGDFVEHALALAQRATGARRGYLALHGPDRDLRRPAWYAATALSDDEVASVREEVSTGIIAQALATGQTIETASAMADDRFASLASVRQRAIGAVLCAPIGADLGVLYLQGRSLPGPFSPEDRAAVEAFSRRLAPAARRLLAASSVTADPTARWRERLSVTELVGRSAAMASVLEHVALVAPLDLDVLLTGPTGAGKTEIAYAIVRNSPRAGRPLVVLNCAAIPEALLESELFGSVPGAFTGARLTEGKVAAAEGGTLFLDEIGEMPVASQSKLLHLLQAREYHPLGASRPKRADVRILAATNVDLDSAIQAGQFRQDLLYRLRVLPIRLPALAERREDIPLLAAAAVGQAVRRLGRLRPLPLSVGAVEASCAAEWPGNVRQLAQVVTAGLIRANADGSERIEVRHLFPDSAETAPTLQQATRQFQREFLKRALERTEWNVQRAAVDLDVSRSHLYELIRALGIQPS